MKSETPFRSVVPAFFLLAASTLATPAYASYAQMRLDGLGLMLAFVLSVAYGVVVDLLLFARIFRHRAAAVAGTIVSLAVIFLLLSQVASPGERAGFFKGGPGEPELVLLVMTSAVFLPFIVIAPFAQYQAMLDERRWPGWITVWMAVQLALLPGFLALAATEQYFWQREYRAGLAEAREIRAGGLSALLERTEQRRDRIWGTGWTYPGQPMTPSASYARSSAWTSGVSRSLDASAVVAANEPLSAADQAALRTLVTRHFGNALPEARAKLLWDALEPGRFSRQLAPSGVNEMGAVDEEVIPILLERLEKHGEARLCPGGRLMEPDRAVLNALILAKGRGWSVEKRAHEMRPEWEGYRLRVERLCRG